MFGQTATQPSGNGSEDLPYLIQNLENLFWISLETQSGNSFSGKHFIQTSNIDASDTEEWFDGQGWLPIGGNSNPFSGIYNGNGSCINGIFINRPDNSYLGLFGVVQQASISNLAVTNAYIQGKNSIGGLAGKCGNSSFISHCYSTGEIIGESNIGGLIGVGGGYDDNSTFCYSYSKVNVTGTSTLGGLVGFIGGKIDCCYSNGSVTGSNENIGGLAGISQAYYGISNCYSTGNVFGNKNVGGLVGKSNEISHIHNSYSTGNVCGEINTGGLIGIHYVLWGDVTNCFWNTETSGQISSVMGTGKNSLEMIHFVTFRNWDFTEIWQILDGESYPFFQWQQVPTASNFPSPASPPANLKAELDGSSVKLTWNKPSVGEPDHYIINRDGELIANIGNLLYYNDFEVENFNTYKYQVAAGYGDAESSLSNRATIFFFPGFDGGDGSMNNPYLISNHDQLNAVRYYPSSCFLQTENIDLTQSAWNQGDGWVPIGDNLNRFRGYYNGNNKSIEGLYINRTNSNNQGLFAVTYSATIVGVNLTNVNVKGNENTGALVGNNRNSKVINCTVSGQVTGVTWVGGIIGLNYSSHVVNCTNIANVHGGGAVGGIAGKNRPLYPGDVDFLKDRGERYYEPKIKYCNNHGNISGDGGLGGIVGMNDYYSYINECSNDGTIIGTNYLGGIAGSNEQGKIANCYNFGDITGTNMIGGIVAWNDDIPEFMIGYVPNVTNSYSVGSITGSPDVGGLVGSSVSDNLVLNSYWNLETSGIIISAGGEIRTVDEMTFPYAENTYIDWDFQNIWDYDSLNINYGYPFFQSKYSLTIEIKGGGKVKINDLLYSHVMTPLQGSEVSLNAVPNTGWTFIGWAGNIISNNPDTAILMDGNKLLVADFERIPATTAQITVLAYPLNGGTVTGSGVYDIASSVSVSATPNANDNYTFNGWYILNSLQSDSENYSFTMPAESVILVAKFASASSHNVLNGFFVKVYPNPTSGALHIVSDLMINHIFLFDIFGRLVFHQRPLNNLNLLNLEGYQTGVYFLKIYTTSGIKTHKLLIIR